MLGGWGSQGALSWARGWGWGPRCRPEAQLPACWAPAGGEHTHQEEAAQEVDAVRVQPAGGRS